MSKNGILNVSAALKAHELYKTIKNKRAVARAMNEHEKQIRRWLDIDADRLKKLSTV